MSVVLQAADERAIAEVSRLLGEEGLATRAPGPSLGQWAAEIGELLRNRLFQAFDWVPGSGVVETGVLVVLVAGLGLSLVLVVLALARRRTAVAPPSDDGQPIATDERGKLARGGAHWRSRLEALLAAGDGPGALEALWSWLLSTVAGDSTDVRPLAGRRLLREAGRLDLLPLVQSLELISYGAEAAEPGRLRALAHRLERETRSSAGTEAGGAS